MFGDDILWHWVLTRTVVSGYVLLFDPSFSCGWWSDTYRVHRTYGIRQFGLRSTVALLFNRADSGVWHSMHGEVDNNPWEIGLQYVYRQGPCPGSWSPNFSLDLVRPFSCCGYSLCFKYTLSILDNSPYYRVNIYTLYIIDGMLHCYHLRGECEPRPSLVKYCICLVDATRHPHLL